MRNLSLGPILTILWAQDLEKEIPLLIIGFIYKEIISFNYPFNYRLHLQGNYLI